MEQRSRPRLTLPAICRVAPARRRRRPLWKQIENISGRGVLLVWSDSEPPSEPPAIGARYVAELPLPTHPAFGERVLELDMKVVRIARQPDGRVMAAFETTGRRFKPVQPRPWPSGANLEWVN